jgi:PKD repeat protein
MKQFSKLLTKLKYSVLAVTLLGTALRAQVLFDNGPYYNSVGTGAGGANESVLYTTTFGMSTIGFGHQITSFNRVADDFALPDCSWRIDSIAFFAYQTGSTTTSTFTQVNLRIWDSIPDAAGSSVVFGDTTTNRLIRSSWSGAYRITETTTGNTTRPIMRNVVNVGGLVLNTGTFWLDWASAGSLASGPWAPARTPVMVAITGNGRQRVGSTWNNLVDGGTSTPAQGLPFVIYGTILDPVADAGGDGSLCPGSAALIGGLPSGSGGLGSLTYSWSPGASLNDSTLANPLAMPVTDTDYILSVTDSTGCTVTDTLHMTVGSVASNFLPSDTTVCPGIMIPVDAGAASSWLWSTGDTTQTISVGAGSYSVSAYDSLGCASVDTILVDEAIGVAILADTFWCEGDTLLLSTTLPSGSHLWSTSDITPTLGVTAAGTYSVTVIDSLGCTSADTLMVNAPSPLPIAMFVYSPGAAGLTYDFTDMSTGSPTTWTWDFGDGGTSSIANPSHSYGTDGAYAVTLVVTNSCGSDTMVSFVTVVGIEGSLAGSAIEISPNPATGQFQFSVNGLEAEDVLVQLTDLQGKVHAEWTFARVTGNLVEQVDVTSLSKGVYFLRFVSGDMSEVRKVTLQ